MKAKTKKYMLINFKIVRKVIVGYRRADKKEGRVSRW